MRIDKLITIGVLAVTALVTCVCVKTTEEDRKKAEKEKTELKEAKDKATSELNSDRCKVDDIWGNKTLSQTGKVKASLILDHKFDDIMTAPNKEQLETAVTEYWRFRGYLAPDGLPGKEALDACIEYEWEKIEEKKRLRQEAKDEAKELEKFKLQKEIASAGKPELKIVNNVTKSDETKETN